MQHTNRHSELARRPRGVSESTREMPNQVRHDKYVKKFQNKILSWYKVHKRSLPWRGVLDSTPLQERAYMILVSEVMSQQTQLSRVVPKYQDWMKAFPTITDLANAKVSEVLHYWSGLGYNRRALNLKKAAEIIVKNFGGNFPTTEKELLALPGIGKYTARAILCFAFDQQVAVVDTNVRKVILIEVANELRSKNYELRTRMEDNNRNSLFVIRDSIDNTSITEKDIEYIAQALLPVGRAYDWNQALMDYAAEVLKKEKIAIPKQSKFLGSHRYYRGQILKKLLEKKTIKVSELGLLIKKDYTRLDELWLQRLVQELITEGFIAEEQGMVVLAS